MGISIPFFCVAIMLLYAVPGFLLVKTKAVNVDSISAIAKLLMYACQPCLTVYAFQKASFSWEALGKMGIFLLLAFAAQGIMLGLAYLCFRKKQGDVRYRVSAVACAFGNCTFMGVPLLEAMLPEYPEAVVYSNVFFVSMSTLGWTLASAIISGDAKYISVKKIVFNPATLALTLALPLYFTGTVLPDMLSDAVTLFGRMTTPLCMVIMGMRLATVRIRSLFSSLQFLIIAIKQLLMPLVAFALVCFLPLEHEFMKTFVILCGCPVASVVLNFSEILGAGQKDAANLVLLGTMASILTLPLISLLC